MRRLSSASECLEGQKMFQILSKANDFEKKGKKVIHFEIGDPDFPTPEKIVDRCVKALREGNTHYTSSGGMDCLKEASANITLKSRGFKPDQNQILVTAGANVQIFYALACICDPGDNVVYGDPAFVSYASIMKFLGVIPNPIELQEEEGFRINVDKIEKNINKNTKAILINSPHNPTGSILSKDDVIAIYQLAKKYDLFLISDEVYGRIYFEGASKFSSPGSIDYCKERTVVLHSFSKSYAMTGWRIGAVTAPAELIRRMQLLLETTSSCVAPFVQIAATEALEMDQSELQSMVKEYESRRDILVKSIEDMPLVSAHRPEGAFYLMVNIKKTGLSDIEFSSRLLEEEYVATCPGSYFGVYGSGYVRICFATSKDNILEGMKRINRFLLNLKGNCQLNEC
jgi:aspartate aminotransferase